MIRWYPLNRSKHNVIEYLQYSHGRIERTPFPLGGYLYTTRRGSPDDKVEVYSGSSFARAEEAVKALVPK